VQRFLQVSVGQPLDGVVFANDPGWSVGAAVPDVCGPCEMVHFVATPTAAPSFRVVWTGSARDLGVWVGDRYGAKRYCRGPDLRVTPPGGLHSGLRFFIEGDASAPAGGLPFRLEIGTTAAGLSSAMFRDPR
jgi:hypothetical protein